MWIVLQSFWKIVISWAIGECIATYILSAFENQQVMRRGCLSLSLPVSVSAVCVCVASGRKQQASAHTHPPTHIFPYKLTHTRTRLKLRIYVTHIPGIPFSDVCVCVSVFVQHMRISWWSCDFLLMLVPSKRVDIYFVKREMSPGETDFQRTEEGIWKSWKYYRKLFSWVKIPSRHRNTTILFWKKFT